MRLILSNNHDPYFNLAMESYFMEESDEDVLLLYRNQPSVVIGKHQNVFKQVNIPYCNDNDIKICRRYSGGGTVYHDMGNLNYAFIEHLDAQHFGVNYDRYTQPIKDALCELGFNATVGKRNDILVEGLKVSGTAQHLNQKRKTILHHGTLLCDADLSSLGKAIRPKSLTLIDKSIDSVRSEVTNLINHLPHYNAETTEGKLAHDLIDKGWCKAERPLDQYEVKAIEVWMVKKYATEDWIFGYNPKFTIEVNNDVFEVRKGVITELDQSILPAVMQKSNNPVVNALFKAFYR